MKAWNLQSNKIAFFNSHIDYYKICAIFRIIVVSLAIIDFISVFRDLRLFLSPHSIVPLELGLLETEYYHIIYPIHDFIKVTGLSLATTIYTLSFLYLLFLVLCLIGFKKYISFFFAIVFQILLFRSMPNHNYGYDHFMTMSLFYCLLFPVDQHFSITKKTETPAYKHSFFKLTFFLKVHLCIVYFTSGIAKAVDPNWWDGNAIWRALANMNDFPYVPPIFFAMLSVATVLLELLYPFLIYTKLRKLTIIHVILMHMGIGLLMGLSSFAAVMISWNLVAFYDDFRFKTKN
ncbi:hypothetical protein [Ascidiimonas aurantiaca]|uniref:hypothetical protein n=1 Tax=Ascidiimonas aurantiaca TaxID=1685432 RepID=UPI0030EEDA1C